MRTRPIIFSGPMVRAILEGRKTLTRVIIKPQPNVRVNWIGKGDRFGEWKCGSTIESRCFSNLILKCPYGNQGDRLWVREAFRFSTADDCDHLDYCGCKLGSPIYRADIDDESKWRPAIHMSRDVSRITLQITRVRVERLQAISMDDAIAEGHASKHPVADFLINWDVSGRPVKNRWKANPWVWVIDFTHESRHLSC